MFLFILYLSLSSLLITSYQASLRPLSPNQVLSFGNLSFPEHKQQISDKLTLHYDYNSTTATFLIINKAPEQFFSIGTSSFSSSDLWTFEIKGSSLLITDCWAQPGMSPQADTSLGGSNDLILLGYEISEDMVVVKFSRLLDTGDDRDFLIQTGELYELAWADMSLLRDDNTLVEGLIGFNFTLNSMDIDPDSEDVSYSLFEHGLLNMIAWGVLMDVSLVVVRHNKGMIKGINFQLIHAILMWVIFVLCSLGIFLEGHEGNQYAITGDTRGSVGGFHGLIGWGVFYLSIVMILAGIYLYQISSRKTSPGPLIVKLKKAHRYVGYLVYGMSKLAMMTGSVMGGGYWMAIVFPYNVALAFLHINLVKKAKSENFYVKFSPIFNTTFEQKSLIHHINSKKASRMEILKQFPNIQWVLYGNYIVDLTNWIHPGGNFLIENAKGREITQFIEGAYTIEEEFSASKPYKHSVQAYKIIQKFIIGSLSQEGILLKGKNDFTSSVGSNWTLVDKTHLSNSLARFEFKSENIKIKPYISTLSGLGRHFAIKFSNKSGPRRTYTTALALTEENMKIRELIFNSIVDEETLVLPSIYLKPRTTLPLFIKKYDSATGFSCKIHEVSIQNSEENQFEIEGPLGRGLELSKNIEGTMTILVGGTGILLFMDLLNYLFIKCAYLIYKARGMNQEAQMLLDMGFDFKEEKNFKVRLFGAFRDEFEMYGYDLIRDLAHLSYKYRLDLFEAVISHGSASYGVSVEKKKFEQEFLCEKIDRSSKIFYVCGPPGFNRSVPCELKKTGVLNENIYLV